MYRVSVFQKKDYKTKDSPPLGIGSVCSRKKDYKTKDSTPLGIEAVCSKQKTIKLKIILP